MRASNVVLFVLLILLAVYVAVYTFAPRPEGGGGDPYYYIYASQTVREGKGFRNFPDAPPETIALIGEPDGIFATWPPGYPLLLALFTYPLIGAWVINAAAFAVSVVAAYGLARDFKVPPLVAGAVAVAWLVSTPAQIIYRAIMTEGIFVAVLILWLRALIAAGNRQQVIVLSVTSTALFALRYSGVVAVGLGGIAVIVLTEGDIVVRLRRVTLYALLPTLFMAWWFLRNWSALGSLTGHRLPGIYDPAWETLVTIELAVGWLPTIIVFVGAMLCVDYCWHFLYLFMRLPRLRGAHTPPST